MRRLFALGETVYDIIFKNDKPVEGRPGGAMLNTAVSLGRLNAPVYLISGFPDDYIGEIIQNFLVQNDVNTDFVTTYIGAKSRSALAFLNENQDANYSFYKIQQKKKTPLQFPEVNEDDIILFGSFYAIKPDIREEVRAFIEYARSNGALIVYDPNFRKAHLNMLDEVQPFIEENIALSDIVKGSNEDFYNVFRTNTVEETYDIVKKISSCSLIYTANKDGVFLKSCSVDKHYPVPAIKPVSTVGAGDSFNAGLIWGVYKYAIDLINARQLKEEQWDQVMKIATEFGTHSCLSFDNYISCDFASQFK